MPEKKNVKVDTLTLAKTIAESHIIAKNIFFNPFAEVTVIPSTASPENGGRIRDITTPMPGELINDTVTRYLSGNHVSACVCDSFLTSPMRRHLRRPCPPTRIGTILSVTSSQ
ncbi:hypothetical protein RUM43_006225 [Polyplax serrata]|uniref:Uncharacterized protein n=1 Tax=Polyplax serrata TaxID=468196 RepID=A0AAN8PYG7_POLSC